MRTIGLDHFRAMVMGVLLAVCTLIVNAATAWVGGTAIAGKAISQRSASNVSFSIVGNARIIWGPWFERKITVFVEPDVFTPDNLRTIFLNFSEQHPSDDHLLIDAISNHEQLEQALSDFTEIQSFPFGNVAPPLFTCASGIEPRSFAGYFRSDGSEFFNYYPAKGEPLHVTIKEASLECAPSGDQAVDMVDGSARGCADLVRKLLDDGADPNAKGRHGGVPLVEAVYWNQPEILRLLLERGADVNQKSSSGWTPLIAAAFRNRHASIELLLRRGADVNLSSIDGRTALNCAVFRQNAVVAKELLKLGADPNAKDGYGKTILAIAEATGDVKLVRLLKNAGARQ